MQKTNISMLFMLINAFLWYYLTLNITTVISENLGLEQARLLSFYSSGVLVGGIISLAFSEKRYKTLILWTFLGVVTSISPLLAPTFTLSHFQLVCFTWGFSFGLGIPICLAYFAETTIIENRGSFGGTTLIVSFFGTIPVASLLHLFDLPALYVFSSIWRTLGFIPLFILRNELKKSRFRKNIGNHSVPAMGNRFFCIYLIPWFMFNIVDALEGMLLKNFLKDIFPEYYALLQLMFLLFVGVFAFLGGFLCDYIGRKPVTIFGFTTMGMAYAVISVAPGSLPMWFLFSICYGLSVGLFDTIFIIVIWGDLAPKGLREKYYFVGTSPLFLASIIQMYFAGYMMFLSEVNAFSLAAIFLFLAVIPILFAPETLPEKTIRERELKSYIEKAKKIKEKYA